MSHEQLLFDRLFRKVNVFLKTPGVYFEEEDVNRDVLQRFLNRRFYCFNVIWIISHLLGELAWGVDGVMKRSASIMHLTYIIPGVTLCLIGIAKSYYFVKHGDMLNDLIKTVKALQAESAKREQRVQLEEEIQKRTVILTAILNANNIVYIIGLSMFAVGPLIISWIMYKATGDIVMQLPFLAKFPFDATDIRYWPMAYFHQMWTSIMAVCTVHAPDSFYSFSCTFLLIQFKTVTYDLQRICPENADFKNTETKYKFKENLKDIMTRHNELIRCVDIMETVYCKSTLGNLAVSSMVICVSAFNVTTIDDIFWMVAFLAFFFMWIIQVFVLCYFSDLLIESSIEVSNAVYHSSWYNADAATMKDLLFVLTRAQKPCKLTALGYTDLNLTVFSKICSSAWSYFALLQTIYKK